MINKKKLAMLPLLTALITMLMFVNLNVTSVAADPDPDPDTMTFNSDVKMEFEIGNVSWISSGKYLMMYNGTKKFDNITTIMPGDVFQADVRPGWGYSEPKPGAWWCVYGELYGMYVGFNISQVWGAPGAHHFNISHTYDHWARVEKDFNFTDTPVTVFEAEEMVSSIKPGVLYSAWIDHKAYFYPPQVGSWWTITYHEIVYGVKFHVSSVSLNYSEAGEDYYNVYFDDVRNATGDPANITVPGPCPVEGVDGVQLIAELETTEYRIKSPAVLLPEDSWWNITAPDELNETQFHVDTSEWKPFIGVFYSYMNIDNINGSTTITAPGVKIIEATWAEAPNVAEIGSCDWFNVIEGITPYTPTCWNITDPPGLAGATFCIDRASDYVFHIDEVLNQAGEPWNFTGLSLANVTAKEFTPAIYVEGTDVYLNDTFIVSIKTTYRFHVWSYEFTLEWDPDVLNCTGVTNGELFAGATWQPPLLIDNVNGKLSLTGAKFDYTTPPAPQVHPKDNNCTLAKVTFMAIDVENLTSPTAYGTSDLTFGDETKLKGVTKNGHGIKYDAIDYYVAGEIIDHQVNVKWLLGDLDYKVETNPGDKHKVGPIDLSMFLASYGQHEGAPLYNKHADMWIKDPSGPGRDGKIDSTDLSRFLAQYGNTGTY